MIPAGIVIYDTIVSAFDKLFEKSPFLPSLYVDAKSGSIAVVMGEIKVDTNESIGTASVV
jgi:hypothetical protein